MQSRTIPALLYDRYRKTPEGIAHYTLDADGKWQPHNWEEYFSDVSRLAKGLMDLGLTAGQNIGIMAPASRQWDVVQMAILFCGGIVVGLDPHDAPENISSIAGRADLQGLVVSDVSLLQKLKEPLRNKLKFIISLGEDTSHDSIAEKVVSLKELTCNEGLEIETHFSNVEENSPATIIFTSGTTGTPKGIQYNHGQALIACRSILESFADIKEECKLVCWLPLSNLYQRIINYCAVIVGAATYYVEDSRQVLQYLPEINPHIFLGVPRFYEKLHSGILENIQQRGTLARMTAGWAMRVGADHSRCLREKKPVGFYLKTKHRLADFILLSRLRSLMGDNLQYMISGSASISRWLLEEFHAMGFLILEAYGISENIIPVAVNRPNSFRFGTVGKPLPGNEITLADDGELLVRGPGVFAGYYNENEAKNPLSEDGFLATGDYANFDNDGYLILTGRKSEIFKTSTGRRIAPVKIEALISRLPYVEQAVIFGTGKPFLVALLSLDPDQLREHARRHGMSISAKTDNIPSECHELIKNDVLQQFSSLQGYMHPGGLLLTAEPFSIKDGELTANLKIRRKHITDKYKEQLDGLYRELEQKKQSKMSDSSLSQKFVVHVL